MKKSSSWFEWYLEEAKRFFGIDLHTEFRKNATLRSPAKWVIGETTREKFTIEYAIELMKYPEWALRHVAFHEVCHVKHALEGLPCFFWATDDESVDALSIGNLNIHKLDARELSSEFGMERKNIETLFQMVYGLTTDFLVNSVLLKSSPVQLETIRFGVVTVLGASRMLENKHALLCGIMESGMWNAISRNADVAVYPDLVRVLVSRVEKVKEDACSYHKMNIKAYENYINALLKVEFKTDNRVFLSMIKRTARSVQRILRDIDAPIENYSLRLTYAKKKNCKK
jgi:hypothetical protein